MQLHFFSRSTGMIRFNYILQHYTKIQLNPVKGYINTKKTKEKNIICNKNTQATVKTIFNFDKAIKDKPLYVCPNSIKSKAKTQFFHFMLFTMQNLKEKMSLCNLNF